MAMAGAAMLKSTFRARRLRGSSQNEMTNASRTTVMVPAAGPNRSTDVKMNVSDTEIRAEIAGTFTVKDPVNSVNAARMNHSRPGGLAATVHRDWPATSRPAAATIAT